MFSHNFSRVFPVSTSVDITVYQYRKYFIFLLCVALRTLTEEWREIFRVETELYQHGSQPISVYILKTKKL